MTTVIIPTVGVGSRMNPFTTDLNKALLPYKGKPILAHIINQFPVDTQFLIPIGHFGEQIVDFCNLAFADHNIVFVPIDDWSSEKSGPGYTLKKCASIVNESFWYVPCDTYFDEPITFKDSDCYFVRQVDKSLSSLYTTFKIDENSKILDIMFKVAATEHCVAFTGLMYIHDHEEFFNRLILSNSNEIVYAFRKHSDVAFLYSWLDFGNPDIYRETFNSSQKFDFAKKDEITYICNNRVVKWWKNDSIAPIKLAKYMASPAVFPNCCEQSHNWLAYDLFPGKTMYAHDDSNTFPKLLDWLNSNLWLPRSGDIRAESFAFYRDKTLLRIQQFKKKYPNLPKIDCIDGIQISETLIDKIDWNYLATTVTPTVMHGDLQFDNIIINPAGEFVLIDWRPDFSGLIFLGDKYYDLAKLYGGLVIDYSKIKDGQFDMSISGTEVSLKIPSITNQLIYQNDLIQYAISNGHDVNKIELLVPIIFLNMAPLHEQPFDQILWYMGLKLLHENLY